MSTANFKVDTRLTSILGETYKSSEYAVRELVDNAYDADAENVSITLPEEFTTDPIVISDDGTGMTEKEVRKEYLFIASSRFSRKGERSPGKKRLVKGRKGIGKFAGLMIGNLMVLETKCRGKKTKIVINKEDILKSKQDLEKVPLPIEIEDCPPTEKGTTITLSQLHQNYTFPNPERLKPILMVEYGRQDDFAILVNGKPLDVEHVPGNSTMHTLNVPGVGEITVKCTIADRPIKQSGVAMRVDGKIIGRPDAFGLDDDETIPDKLHKRVYAEISAPGLRDDVTADWGAIVENSQGLQQIQKLVQPLIREQLNSSFTNQFNLQKARLQKKINSKLAELPEHRRRFAEMALERVLKKFYDESEERQETVISVMLDAFEKDDYYEVLQHIDESKDSTISEFVEALTEFGLLDLSLISRQAKNRVRFLDYLTRLVGNDATLEKDIHRTIENNPWLFGNEYALMSSNETLKSVVERFCEQKYSGTKANLRPDLLLSEGANGSRLLIEFKRPDHKLNRADEGQAQNYRDELRTFLGSSEPIDVIVIGGTVEGRMSSDSNPPRLKSTTYNALISTARTELNWLLRDLKAQALEEIAR